jgi:hypothetical protein
MESDKRKRAIQAFHVLNALLGDLIIGCRVRELLGPRMSAKPALYVLLNRLCLSHLFLACCKWLEFYQYFHDIVPRDCVPACRGLRKRIAKLGVVEFRNKHVGHIIDRRRGRPLTLAEVQLAVDHITEGDGDAFAEWCAGPKKAFPDSFASIVERTRLRIEAEFGLSEEDVFPGDTGAA